MVPEFDEVVFAAEVGTITPIFSTRFGLHIALVPEVRPEGIIPFEELAERLAESFYEELKGARISEQIEQLESRANVRRAFGA
jgi:parvulin-like peptidyl-prolyl isomerase